MREPTRVASGVIFRDFTDKEAKIELHDPYFKAPKECKNLQDLSSVIVTTKMTREEVEELYPKEFKKFIDASKSPQN